jgi:hypothetical protein
MELDELKQSLPEQDAEYLASKCTKFEVIKNASDVHVIFHDYAFPEAYQARHSNLLIVIPAGYPNAKLDMFWTYPDVRLISGKWPTSSEDHQDFHGKNLQRWSSHINRRSVVDSLRTFITSVQREIAMGI